MMRLMSYPDHETSLLPATSLIRPPHYSGHTMEVPNIAKAYFMTSVVRPSHCKDHAYILVP